jgi:hypothetical protein
MPLRETWACGASTISMHPTLALFLKLTLAVAVAIVALILVAFLLKIAIVAALVAAVIFGGFFLYNWVRRARLPVIR